MLQRQLCSYAIKKEAFYAVENSLKLAFNLATSAYGQQLGHSLTYATWGRCFSHFTASESYSVAQWLHRVASPTRLVRAQSQSSTAARFAATPSTRASSLHTSASESAADIAGRTGRTRNSSNPLLGRNDIC